MTRRLMRASRSRLLGVLCTGGMMFQLGGCELGEVTTTTSVTLDGREVILSLVRSAVLTPLDAWLTNTVNDFFSDNK